ncbi:MAG: anti-sigma factor family protein, partial [Stellaceae bacterium]
MPKPTDERLIAYLDGELGEDARTEIAAQLEHDSELGARAQRLSESAALLRSAYDEVLREPLPERLIAAARGENPRQSGQGNVLRFGARIRRTIV